MQPAPFDAEALRAALGALGAPLEGELRTAGALSCVVPDAEVHVVAGEGDPRPPGLVAAFTGIPDARLLLRLARLREEGAALRARLVARPVRPRPFELRPGIWRLEAEAQTTDFLATSLAPARIAELLGGPGSTACYAGLPPAMSLGSGEGTVDAASIWLEGVEALGTTVVGIAWCPVLSALGAQTAELAVALAGALGRAEIEAALEAAR